MRKRKRRQIESFFPHNFRHLFARTFYSLQKDIVRLADILGHSSINTTRIYTMETGEIHRRQIQHLGLFAVLKKKNHIISIM
ncbi:MAG: tyrosine-type recombinase/integrase [Clostridiales bacterium]|nr:MAG: tyrosine-type recombinase/integrase [Clostridiales bacterium]